MKKTGFKKLKYPIQNKRTGFYHMFEHESDPQTTKELEVEFKRDERVLRWLSVKLDKHAIEYAEKRKKKTNKKLIMARESEIRYLSPVDIEKGHNQNIADSKNGNQVC